MSKLELQEQEWSHFFDVDDLNKAGKIKLTIEASEEECADLARRFRVESISQISAGLNLSRGAGIIHVLGQFTCVLVQNCVVSLNPFESTLSESVEGWFADKETTVSFAAAKKEREVARTHGEVEILNEHDDPEPIIQGCIDLGELVSQHISLAIPAYPQKEGVSYEHGDENVKLNENSPLRRNPFEALKDWKENR